MAVKTDKYKKKSAGADDDLSNLFISLFSPAVMVRLNLARHIMRIVMKPAYVFMHGFQRSKGLQKVSAHVQDLGIQSDILPRNRRF